MRWRRQLARLRAWGQLPWSWHLYDPTCECAACEDGQPRSPYRKVGHRRWWRR